MAYEPRINPGNRLGMYAENVEAKREQLGLDEKGFRLDGDAAGADKEAMLREIYRRENARLPYGIGGDRPSNAAETSVGGEA